MEEENEEKEDEMDRLHSLIHIVSSSVLLLLHPPSLFWGVGEDED